MLTSASKGMFREKYDEPQRIVGATKWCVFKDMDPTAEAVRAAVNERLERMQVNTVDILQVRIATCTADPY